MDREDTHKGILLSHIKECNTLYVQSKKYKKLANITKKKQTHRDREQTSGYWWRE